MIWSTLDRARRDAGASVAMLSYTATPGCRHDEAVQEWAWADVFARSSLWAQALRTRGLRPGDRVALLAPNGPQVLLATYAAAHVGAVLVPLNLRLVAREQARVLRRAAPRLLLASSQERAAARAALEAAPDLDAPMVELEALAEQALSAAEPEPPYDGDPDTAAHLYFTSGSSGVPKGVVLTHRNVVRHAENAIRELDLGRADRWAHVAPMFHLADAWATVALTAVGGRHLFLPRFEPGKALALLRDEGITITNLVPTMLNDMLRHGDAGPVPSLRLLLSGGAPIAPAQVAEIERVFGCPYAQTYGLTETSPYLTISLLDERHASLDEDAARAARARTGRPFHGVEVEVVDERKRRVPADDHTVGEVRARGETVTPGYWQDPERTAEALRGGWLYTGDLATVDALGSLRIVDRRQDRILTGGENVYSTEVEAVLYEHEGVREAAVFGLPDRRWGEAVQAAVVARTPGALDPEDLRAFCRQRLAGYKVPKRVHLLEALPRTGSGKLSKRLLREAFSAPAAPGAGGAAPSGADPASA